MGIGVEGKFDRVTLREIAENDLSPRLERVPGVASVSVEGGLRRQIHVELSKEKITALQLPVNRIIQLLRSENQNVPLGEIDEGDRTYLLRSQGQFENLQQIRDLVVMTRTGVPVYLKDIAVVSDATEDFRSFTRINGNPGVRLRVTKQSGQNTVAIADAVRVEVNRINNEIPGLHLQVLDDNSIFIKRSIASVQEAAVLGSILVILIIFVFLRNLRSTLIICTSIPISIIGTFALLYFGGFTLNTLTFGGLALGVGMIVDAAIVVLENTFRHMEMGKSRMQASIEGSEEVWSAILASTLTHIAVFVPLLFLTGVSSILFKQLAYVVMFSLSMSLFVAVTIVPVLCSRLLKLPVPVEQRKGLSGRLFTISERWLDRLDDFYTRILHSSLAHRPTVIGVGTGLVVLAVLILPTIGVELMPQADEGEVSVTAELAVGTRIERGHDVALRLESLLNEYVPEKEVLITNAGGGGFMGGGGNRVNATLRLVNKHERKRTSEEIARDLNRQLAGVIPGVIISTRASGGNQQMNRMMGGGDSRLSLEIRGDDLQIAREISTAAKNLMDKVPAVRNARISREEGRPELAIDVDRPKAALLGLSVTNVADSIRTNVAGHAGSVLPTARQRISDHRPAAGGRPRARRRRQRRVDQRPERTGDAGEKPAHAAQSVGADRNPAQESGAYPPRLGGTGSRAERGREGRRCADGRRARHLRTVLGRFRRGSRAAGTGVPPAAGHADPRRGAGLRRHGIPVRVAPRSVHHHVLGPARGDRRRGRTEADEHDFQHAGLHRRNHAGGHRRQ